MNAEHLNEALQLYVGWKLSPTPDFDPARVARRFRDDDGERLMNAARQILEELDRIKPDWTKHSLLSASEHALNIVRANHPELNNESAAALLWVYSYGYK